MNDRQILTVTEANRLAKNVLEDLTFWVSGEITDFKGADSRYYYIFLSLKDPQNGALLPCIIDPAYFAKIDVPIENGMSVAVWGNLTLFERSGKFEFRVVRLEPHGESVLSKQLEELKNKLQAEGLFHEERKRKLPPYPTRVGVITSAAGEAWHDFKKHSAGKFPIIELYLRDVYVQGTQAPKDLVQALTELGSQDLDIIVVTRGGGSAEDLAAFNTEEVARAIFASSIPVVTAIGHEKDVSIADLVADVRASTPTAAANAITAAYTRAFDRLQTIWQRLSLSSQFLVSSSWESCDQLLYRLGQSREKYKELPFHLAALGATLKTYREKLLVTPYRALVVLFDRLEHAVWGHFDQQVKELAHCKEKLDILSPQATLDRGYAIAYTKENAVVKSTTDIVLSQELRLRLAHGQVRTRVLSVQTPQERKHAD